MKKVSFVFLILFFPKLCFAKQVYFDFNLPSLLLYAKSEIAVNFSYSIKGADENSFTVIPTSDQSLVEIYNEETRAWNKQGDLRSGFPKLKPEMKIRFTSFPAVRTLLCFDIQYLKTSEIFQAPCKTFWNRDYFTRYIDAINVKILGWVKEKTVE